MIGHLLSSNLPTTPNCEHQLKLPVVINEIIFFNVEKHMRVPAGASAEG